LICLLADKPLPHFAWSAEGAFFASASLSNRALVSLCNRALASLSNCDLASLSNRASAALVGERIFAGR